MGGAELHWESSPMHTCTNASTGTHWWQWLERQYGEPQRHYHTLTHLEEMFLQLDRHAALLSQKDRQQMALAVFFHDSIYNPVAKDNEEQSAMHFRSFASATTMPGPLVDRIADFILQTKDHLSCSSDDPALRLFLDADLAILAAPRPRYEEYCRQVRLEYGHLSDSEFRGGRCAFLQHLLQQPFLFLSLPFRETFEVAARDNVVWELQRLSG
eukprot:GGOE01003565.1.p1 GENE.GGOE01003565.1~~GGOE01003565.1.p1  ORF type:complete len:213 (-),score=46.21 GGOE01003565.1:153-791(-)